MIRVSLCQRNKSRGIFTWYVRIFDTETKEIRYESLGTTRKTEARELMLAKHAEGEFSKKKGNPMTVRKVFDLYEADCESRGVKPGSLITIRNCLSSLSAIFEKPVNEVSRAEVLEAFNASMNGCKPSTYNNKKTIVRTAFRFAKDVLEVIDRNPAESIKSVKNMPKEREFWTTEQVNAIINATENSMYRLCFAFMAYAGFRSHEAMKVKPEDIKDGFVRVVGKGGKFAKVPISSMLQNELDRVGGKFDFSRIVKGTLDFILERTAKKALGDSFSGQANPHRFRHSFASNLIRAGASVKAVQMLMRHSNIQTTLNIYSHLIDEDLSEEIEKMFK